VASDATISGGLTRAGRRSVRGGARVTVIEPRRHGLLPAAREVWKSRSFIWYFGRGFIRKRTARTFLGVLWFPLRPTISLLSKLLVFGGIAKFSSGTVAPYALFFLTTSAIWQFFHECAYWATRSMDVNKVALRTVHVPRVTVVLSAMVPALTEFLIYGSFAVISALYYLARAHKLYFLFTQASIYEIPAGLFLIFMLGIGLGLITATAGARTRDVRFTLTFVLSFAYWLTPVVYPLTQIPQKYRPIAELNPVTGAMQLVKKGLFGGQDLSPEALVISCVAVVLLWIPGVWIFHRAELKSTGANAVA
jgi:lipopolysaccharide transport system permease protein